ncbi:MAG: hypothetical protein ABJ251_21920 [Paracoccaceae bacterium]
MSNQRDIETHDARPVLRSETAGWTFDIGRVKRLDKPNNVEIKMRALFLGVSCLLLYFTYDMVEMLVGMLCAWAGWQGILSCCGIYRIEFRLFRPLF